MFDVGFWELLFVLTLALLVLGPDKLPGVVSSAGRWLGRARVLARGLRMQIERELDKPIASTDPTSDGSTPPAPEKEAKASSETQDSKTSDDTVERD